MNFEEFQNQSRFYVVGALEPGDVEEFERERKKFGKKAEDFVTQCYALHEELALSLRSLKASALYRSSASTLAQGVQQSPTRSRRRAAAELCLELCENKKQAQFNRHRCCGRATKSEIELC